jgi:hypothetical protein
MNLGGTNARAVSAALFLMLVSGGQSSFAQSIQVTAERFAPAPSLPLAPSASAAQVAAPTPDPLADVNWKIRTADQNFVAMLKRWGAEHSWKVVDKGAPEIRIEGDASLDRPTFLSAADYAVSQARAAGHRIKAEAYANKVLVLTEDTEQK